MDPKHDTATGYTPSVCAIELLSMHHFLTLGQDRRRIEKEAFEGRLLGIVATNALELGVDIGVLDAVMMFGFPRGGVASFVCAVFIRIVFAIIDSMWGRGNRLGGRAVEQETHWPYS